MIFLMARKRFLWPAVLPCQRCIILYFQQMLNTSWERPMLKSRKLSILYLSTLWVTVCVGPFKIFQKYLNFSISKRHPSGSAPQNMRTIDGDVERGQFMRFFRMRVWIFSSSLTNPPGSAGWLRWQYLLYDRVCAQYSRTGLITSLYSLIAVFSLSPSSWNPCLPIIADLMPALSLILLKWWRKRFAMYLEDKA